MKRGAAEFLAGLPLFAALSAEEIEDVAWAARPFRLRADEYLCRQGAPADEMFALQSGRVELSIRIAGSAQRSLGTLAPGAVLGETALVGGGTRTASARALVATRGWSLHRRTFDVLRAACRPSAAKVLRHLAALISDRIAGGGNGVPPPARPPADLTPYRRAAADLDIDNLRALPVLAGFDPGELRLLLGEARSLDLPKRTVLFNQGDPPGAAYLTVRGAIEICIDREGRRDKLALQGPGTLFGEAGLFGSRRRSATAWARERSQLLEVDREAFDRLFARQPVVAFKFLDAVVVLLVELMRRSIARQAWFEADRSLAP